MKNLFIAFLLVVILLLSSFLYRDHRIDRHDEIYHGFPVSADGEFMQTDAPLHLYVFFSEQNCPPCMEVFDVLNALPPPFSVTGIVPERELLHEAQIRERTGAAFPLVGVKDFRKFATLYTPTILGVSAQGGIYFVLPAVPGENEYFMTFLESFYAKAFPLLLETEGRHK